MFIKAIGCFQGRDSSYDLMGNLIPNTNVKASAKLGYSSAYMVPAQKENIPALYTAIIMLRIF